MIKADTKPYKDYFDLDEIIGSIKKYLPVFDSKKFVEAFEFAELHHRNQTRKDGKPYITHPVETVKKLINLHVDEDTLIAALLHDVPEDTEADLADIKQLFGSKVTFLVDGITKLSKVYYRNDMEERQIESLKKLLIHTAKDPRVILIKLADRFHNMETLEYISNPEKRIRIAKETLEIYVPIANLLGIQELKASLEDLCFKHLYPEDYKSLKSKIAETVERQQGTLDEMMKVIIKELKKSNIQAKVYGREKSLYSIYKKIISENKTINDINDRIAFRIITKKVSDCYAALGVVHNLFTPKPGRFKDYIAVPKVNGYQSIHTTVFCIGGVLTEIQIRTERMHTDAEYGIAAHYFYDVSKSGGKNLIEDQRSSWTAKILDLQKSQNGSRDFISTLKIDIFQDRIFVFTPEGETIDLPKNATAIDFAYAIHSDIGNHAVNAEINNQIKPVTTILKTGDHVNVITAETQTPKLLWLSFAKTHIARNKIKLFLKKETLKKKVFDGMEMLQKEFDRAGFGLVEDVNFKKLNSVIQEKLNQNFDSVRALYVSIGEGNTLPVDIIKCVKLLKKITTGFENKVAIKIISKNRPSMVKDIVDVLVSYNADFSYVQGRVSFFRKKGILIFYINFASQNDFSEVCQHIEQIEGVESVTRIFRFTVFYFYTVAITTIAFWALHPLFIASITSIQFLKNHEFILNLLLYFGLFMLLFTVVYLKKIIRKSFPSFRNVEWLWIVTFLASTVAVFALIIELYTLNIRFNWAIIFGGILVMYAYLSVQYINYKNTIGKRDKS